MGINRNSKEKQIEDILEIHPYLIDENLVNGTLKRQFSIKISGGRFHYIDLIYFKKKNIYVIELKREEIKEKDVSQLSEYVKFIKSKHPNQDINGILVGQRINEKIKGFLEIRGFNYKQLFKDIPLQIKICSECRKAVDSRRSKCKWCNSNDFLTL